MVINIFLEKFKKSIDYLIGRCYTKDTILNKRGDYKNEWIARIIGINKE